MGAIVLDKGAGGPIENVIVRSSAWTQRDIEHLFSGEPVHFTDARDFPNLLVEIGVFASTSKARHAGRSGPIPDGWTDNYKASKKRRIWIWNPTE